MNHEKLHSVILIITILLGIVFSWDYKYSYAEKATKVETWTWLSPIQSNTTLSWATSNPKEDKPKIETKPIQDICDLKCKRSKIIEVGVRQEITDALIKHCKALAQDAVHCLRIGASISIAESGWWKACKSFNCMWIHAGKVSYASFDEWVEAWTKKYIKWWYKAPNMAFFYPPAWQKSKSRYCTSEHSTWTSIGCPAWLKNSTAIYNKLTF